MIRIIKEINLEVTKPNIIQAIVAKQYDMNSRFLKVTFMDDGSRIDIPLTETTKTIINAERIDGESKGFDGVINEDGTVTVPLHSWMLELNGTVICDISVIDTANDEEKKLTTTSFNLIVEKAAYGGDDVTTDPQYDVLIELIERVEDLEKGVADQTYNPESKNAQSGKAVAEAVKDKVSYIFVNEFMLGENVLTADKIGTATNWTTDGNTFTHTSGSAEPLKIDLGDLTVAGDEWLVTFEFTTPITGDNLLYLSFGTEALTQTYNGTNSIAVALRVKENGDDLLLTPVSSFNGTLSNLKIQKIDKNGVEPYEFVTDSIITKDRQICKTGFWNIILGTEHTMTNAPNSSRTIVIGHNALRQLRSGNRNIAIGTFAMSVMESGEQNISVGADSMFNVEKSEGCIVIGKGAMAYGKNLKDNIVIGNGALNGNANSTSFYNIVIGKNAGLSCVGERNIIMGYQCAMDLSQGIANVYIGDQCTGLNGKNQNTIIGASAKAKGSANRSIAIGYTAETTKENQCVLGGDNIVETLLKGTIIVRGTDGVKRQIAFNTDGSCSWSEVA